MRVILPAILVCMCACATTKTTQSTTAPIDESFFTPPNTNDLLVENDRKLREHEAAMSEEAAYWKSLEKISAKFHDETMRLFSCLDQADINKCVALRNTLCIVDTLIDSRGGHHNKNYCALDFKF
jgi:hypothetical protein